MTTKRSRITADLRTAVEAMAPGTRLPSENELARRYEVSRETIRAVLRTLTTDGLIRTDVGVGAAVRDRSVIVRDSRTRLTRAERLLGRGAHLTDAGQRPVLIDVDITFRHADNDIADWLEVTVGDEVCVRRRIMGIDTQPTQLATSYLPRTITRGTSIEQEDTGTGGIHARLEDAGHTIASHTEEVRLQRVTDDHAHMLDVPPGAPCFEIVRSTRSTDGQVLEVNHIILTDRYLLVYGVPAEEGPGPGH
jgi:GntR family transcriptional regulator